MKTHKLPFSRVQLVTLLEAARIALSDAEVFDHIAGEMDVKDEELCDLRDALEKYMSEDPSSDAKVK